MKSQNSKSSNYAKSNGRTKSHSVYNLIILDESGSMESIKSGIISGFNEVIQSIKGIGKKFTEQRHFVSFVTFNGLGIKTLLECVPVNRIKPIDENIYNPDSMTPLYDAIGFSVNSLRKNIAGDRESNVIVTILTDGLENASKEYCENQIKELIENLKKNKWEFTYIGTDHDVDKSSKSISIINKISFNKNEESIDNMFASEKMARVLLCGDIYESYSKK